MTPARKHTDEEISRAARAAESFDPASSEVRDVAELRAVAEAADEVDRANARLRDAVAVAYLLAGYSWNRIAIALGVSRQAARQRYAEWVEAKRNDPDVQDRLRRLLAEERSGLERLKQ